jgi:protein ImuA
MKLISCHDGKLHALETGGLRAAGPGAFRTGLAALDALSPGGAFARGAVHELLTAPSDGKPLFLAALLARGAGEGGKVNDPPLTLSPPHLVAPSSFPSPIIWSDPHGELYPPALAALGIPLERLFLLHPGNEADQVWALAECLRCRGVAAAVAALPPRQRLSRVEARRLQLAAERGGGVGLLLRTAGKASAEHAATTRWLVRPERGERHVQRWRIQLVFGHGGRVGQAIILEHHRDAHRPAEPLRPRLTAHPVRPAAELADRPAVPPARRAAR